MKTLYLQIESKFLPYLTNYKEDITKHDKKSLENYTGKLLYGCRTTGSSLIKLDLGYFDYLLTDEKIQDIQKHIFDKYIIYILGPLNNTKFAYNDKGKIKEISEAEAKQYATKEARNISLYYENERRKQENQNYNYQY